MTQSPPNRIIRSYVRRQGRMSETQKKSFSTLWSQYGVDQSSPFADFDKLFDRAAPCVLEIGFGMGHSILAMAQQFPHINFVGAEVHRPGIGALFIALEKYQLKNVRVFCADATDLFKQTIPDRSLSAIHIFFPDPWPKTRHHKRRLIQTSFLELIYPKLENGGKLLIATDWQDYATHIMRVISATTIFHNPFGENQFAPRPLERPLTKYELRGQRLGHPVWDFCFLKNTIS